MLIRRKWDEREIKNFGRVIQTARNNLPNVLNILLTPPHPSNYFCDISCRWSRARRHVNLRMTTLASINQMKVKLHHIQGNRFPNRAQTPQIRIIRIKRWGQNIFFKMWICCLDAEQKKTLDLFGLSYGPCEIIRPLGWVLLQFKKIFL